MSTLLDSYSESNYTASSTAAATESRGQSFTSPSTQYNLVSCKFYVYTDTGNVTTRAKLYAHSGTYGTNGVPTGSVLATSSDVVVNQASSTLITYTFGTPYLLSADTYYFIVLEAEGGESNNFKFGYDGTPEHSGNYASYTGSSWSASSARDLIFYVYGDPNNVTVNVPTINISCAAKNPTLQEKSNIPVINITCEAKTPLLQEKSNIPAININCEAKIPTLIYPVKIDVPLINISCEAKVPTLQEKLNIPVVNISCEAKVPEITYNIRTYIPTININCEAKVPEITYNIKIHVPVINISCEAKVPEITLKEDIVINCPLIEVICEALTPRIRIIYPVIISESQGNIFTRNRYEKFEYELLSLSNERYENAGWITDYVKKDSGNITMDFSRDVIGTASFLIRNNEDINYLSDLVRPWYVLNDTYRYPLGTYMLSSPSKKLDGKYVSRYVQGYDLLLAMDQDKMITSYTIEAGTNIVTAIETIIYSYTTLWTEADITPSDEVLAVDVSYELGKSKLFIINSLLNMINYYPLWCDGYGVFRSIPWSAEKNTTYEFIDNNLSIYTPNVDLVLDYTGIYNRVVIINNQLEQDTAPLYKVWTFENEGLEDHPFSYATLGRYITKIFQSEAVSQDYVDLRARRELLKMLEIEEAVNYNHAYISARENDGLPWQGDSYRFVNSKLNIDSIYKIELFSFNLKVGGLVNSKIKRIRSTY